MSQIQRTTPPQKQKKPPIICRGCQQEIKFHPEYRRENGSWVRLNLDISEHHRNPNKEQHQSQPQLQEQSLFNGVLKEIMSIKAQLLAAVNRLDYLEKELKMRK